MASCTSAPKEVLPPDMKDGIRAAIKGNQDKFARCHNEALKRKNGFVEGTVHVQWEINEKGRAKNAGIKAVDDKPFVDPKFERCLIATIEKIKFPAASQNQFARVVYPFIFKK